MANYLVKALLVCSTPAISYLNGLCLLNYIGPLARSGMLGRVTVVLCYTISIARCSQYGALFTISIARYVSRCFNLYSAVYVALFQFI